MNKLIKKYKSLSEQTKAVFWFTGCNFLQKGISFVTVPIFTRLMSTDEYGLYTLYSSWYQILIIFSSLYLFNGVFENGMSKFDDDRDRFTAAMMGLSCTTTMMFFAIYLFSNQIWQEALGLPSAYILLMFAEMAVSPAIYFWSGRQRFEYRYKRLVLITIMKSLANPILGLLLVYNSPDKAFSRVLSIVLVEIVFDFTLMIYQFARGKIYFEKKYWNYAITLAIPMIPHYLAGMILNQGDRIVIDYVEGKTAVALYGVAYSIGMLAQIFVNAIHSAMTPWVYKCIKNKEINALHRKYKEILLVVAVIIVGLVIVSPELVYLFGSEKYRTAVYVIPPIAASVYFIFLYGIYSFPEFYYEKTKFLMIASLGAAVLNVALNYLFVPRFGFVAAGYTTLLCYILYSTGHFVVGTKILRKHDGNSKITMLDSKSTVLISSAVVMVCLAGSVVVSKPVIRYSIVLLLVILAIRFRKKLISMIAKGTRSEK